MTRYNIFYQVHKGLRVMLYETATLIQQTDFVNAAEAAEALNQTEDVLNLFDKHANTEDTLVFSSIQPYEPAVVDELEKEHMKDHELGQRLRGLITAFEKNVSVESKMEVAAAINKSFVEFMVFNLEHMAKEENIINKALWKHYTDEQLHMITQKIVGSMPPEAMAMFSKWMMRGLSNDEISGWLKEVKNNAPDFVFNGLMETAANELADSRWIQVQENLTEGAMVV
jgi:Hemerythrin HHE cation binding domain